MCLVTAPFPPPPSPLAPVFVRASVGLLVCLPLSAEPRTASLCVWLRIAFFVRACVQYLSVYQSIWVNTYIYRETFLQIDSIYGNLLAFLIWHFKHISLIYLSIYLAFPVCVILHAFPIQDLKQRRLNKHMHNVKKKRRKKNTNTQLVNATYKL